MTKQNSGVKFHDTLNPKLFYNQTMKPEIRQHLLKIAQDFMDNLGIEDPDDITISGSNAAYTYTPFSDIDLHIIYDYLTVSDKEVYQELYKVKKVLYNDKYDIKVKDIPVELYVQDVDETHFSLGIYSVLHNRWISRPTKTSAKINHDEVKEKYKNLKEVINLALKADNVKQVNRVIDTIKRYRQAGLTKGGEFSPENIAFKMARNADLLTKLFAYRDELHSASLSLAEKNKKI